MSLPCESDSRPKYCHREIQQVPGRNCGSHFGENLWLERFQGKSLSPEIEEGKVRDAKWSQTELFGRESNSIDTPEEKGRYIQRIRGVGWGASRHASLQPAQKRVVGIGERQEMGYKAL